MSSESEGHVEEVSLYFVLFGSLLALVIIGSKLLHDRPRLSSFVSEASLTLLIGISAGMLVHLIFFRERPDDVDFDDAGEDAEAKVVASSLLTFSDNVFFMALLPPILFNSGYQIRRELFYRHIKAILTFACIGTAISAITTAFMLQGVSLLGWMGEDSNLNTFKPSLLELLTFGSLISATDTVSVLAVFQSKQVDPHLFYLVYGESALNDGVALVLFKTFAGSVNAEGSMARRVTNCLMDVTVEAIGSPALGVVFGFGTALLFKHLDFRSTPMLELPLYIVLLMYVPFITAECLNLSGIVAILFSGISARRYISPNVSVETARNAEVIFKMAAYIAETCIFLELGLSVFGLARSFKWKFIAWSFLASMIGRALAIFPLTWLLNLSLRCSPPTTTRDEEDESSIVTAVSTMLASEWITPTRRLDKKISCNFATVLWFAGMRGAVAYGTVIWQKKLLVLLPNTPTSHGILPFGLFPCFNSMCERVPCSVRAQ